MSEREIERILQECNNEEEVEKATEEYLTFWDDTCDDFEEKEYV